MSKCLTKHINSNVIKYSVFVIFMAFLLKQCLLFEQGISWAIEPFSSLWNNPSVFFNYYTGKLLMPLIIASFVLISKHYWWTCIVFAITTIWCIANLMYYDFFWQPIDLPAILLTNNMNGAWSLVLSMWTHTMTEFSLLLLYYIIIIVLLEVANKKYAVNNVSQKSNALLFISCLICVLFLSSIHNYRSYKDKTLLLPHQLEAATELGISPSIPTWVPLGIVINTAKCSPIETKPNWKRSYVKYQSILTYILGELVYECFRPTHHGQYIELSEQDINKLTSYINSTDGQYQIDFKPTRSLCILLIESFESWPITQTFEGKEIMPNLNRLIRQNHVLYCDRMKCQIRRGQSGDGQMLVNSGILPLEDYVACMQYCDNVYPNYAHCYESSVIVNPWPNCWKQDIMTSRYGYQSLIEPQMGLKAGWKDDIILDTTMTWLKEHDSLFCALAITMSTHTPFTSVQSSAITNVDGEWPQIMVDYIRSFIYLDSCIGEFLNFWMSNEKLQQSTLVITGDHTISQQAYNSQQIEYLHHFAPDGFYVPFIMYSQDIETNHYFSKECFQMDIFPTILAAIGGNIYYWQGFGRNLLDSEPQETPNEEHLFDISAKMIKGNFFEHIENTK